MSCVDHDQQQQRIVDLEAQVAARDVRIAEQDRRIAELMASVAVLEKKVAALASELGRNSSNSNLPPSSDSPAERAKKNAKRGGTDGKRKRGGQPNHRGSKRELLPADKVDDVVDFFPSHCEHCAASLPETQDAQALRFQLTELPAFEPHTTEYRRHTVKCLRCRRATTAPQDASIPASPFGPRLMSVVGLLTGVYHVSRRKTVQLLSDMVGVDISLGAVSAVEKRVSDAVAKPVQEAFERALKGDVKHTDGTTWYQSGIALSLWVIATTFATVYKILANGQKETLKSLFGKSQRGVLVSDRATALTFWAMERRQICWAHLLRKFISFSERDGLGGKMGRELLGYAGIIFDYWHQYRDKTLDRETFLAWMVPVRQQFETLLERAAKSGAEHVAGSCEDMLAHRAALWTFVDEQGVDPTNNHAERELRAFVLWRKRCYGSQSQRGNQFAERLMTVAHTASKQDKNVLEFLTECCVAHLDGGRSPSLFSRAA